jgi:transcription elongation factor Elf1
MSSPGDDGGDCLRCGTTTVQVGHGHSVVGVHCPHCGLLVSTTDPALSFHDARERFGEDHDQARAYEDHIPDTFGL